MAVVRSTQMTKVTANVYKDGALFGKNMEITLVDRPIAGTYGKIKGNKEVTKMGSNWYL